jgi:hypothetical protein
MNRLGPAERRKVDVAWDVAEDDETWRELTVHDEAGSGNADAPDSRTRNLYWLWITAVSVAVLVVLMGVYLSPQTQAGQAAAEPERVDVAGAEHLPVTGGSDATQLSTFNPGASTDWQQPARRESAVGQASQCADNPADGGRIIRFRNGYILP